MFCICLFLFQVNNQRASIARTCIIITPPLSSSSSTYDVTLHKANSKTASNHTSLERFDQRCRSRTSKNERNKLPIPIEEHSHRNSWSSPSPSSLARRSCRQKRHSFIFMRFLFSLSPAKIVSYRISLSAHTNKQSARRISNMLCYAMRNTTGLLISSGS